LFNGVFRLRNGNPGACHRTMHRRPAYRHLWLGDGLLRQFHAWRANASDSLFRDRSRTAEYAVTVARDWLGTVFMALGLGSPIAFLEEGQNDDWYTSVFIQRCFALSVIFIPLFIICELVSKTPVVNLRLLRIRNLGVASAVNFC
jgi:hypothetical protein